VSLALTLLALGLAASALCSGAETGFYALNPLKLRHAARDSAAAALLHRLIRSPAGFLAALLVANNLANDAMVQAGIALLEARGVADAPLWATAFLVPVVFLFGEMLPKQWMAVHAESAMPALAWPLAALRLLMFPVALPLLLLARVLEGRSAQAAVLGRQQWAALLREGEGSSPGEARVMGAALRALQARGRGLSPFLRPGIPLLPADADRARALRALGETGAGFVLLEQPGGPPTLLTGARLLQADAAQPPADLATPLLRLPSGCDLAGAFVAMRESGVALAWAAEPGGRSGHGLLDLEYALSLLIAPPAPAASGPA
jgi:hypothetical protein